VTRKRHFTDAGMDCLHTIHTFRITVKAAGPLSAGLTFIKFPILSDRWLRFYYMAASLPLARLIHLNNTVRINSKIRGGIFMRIFNKVSAVLLQYGQGIRS